MRHLVSAGIVFAAWLVAPIAWGDDPRPDLVTERAKAVALSREHKDLEALPLLNKIATEAPDDREIQEYLAVALLTQSATLDDAGAAPVIRRSREILVRLQQSGPLSDLGRVLLEKMPAEGQRPRMSEKKEIDAALREGEAAFARRDYVRALDLYERAYTMDPRSWAAALFAGDSWFARGNMERACEWFARAAAIDPDKAGGFRYWGDALERMGQSAEARLKYLRGIVAEPYQQAPWLTLARWAKIHDARLAHPRILPEEGQDRKVQDGTALAKRYESTRAAWKGGKFAREYPFEKTYRHTLREEAEALRNVSQAVAGGINDGSILQLDPALANLTMLDKAGLLEAYILLARPDAGIAQDYVGYRNAHRDVLMRYLTEYVAPPKPSAAR